MSRSAWGYVLVSGAALCWATIGIFYTFLVKRHGLPPLTVVAYRTWGAGLVLGLVLLLRGRKGLLVRREDVPLFLAYILVGIVLFYIVYMYAIIEVGVSVAVVLLYTSPAWVALIAHLVLREPMDRRILVALGCTWGGVLLVSRVLENTLEPLNGWGLLLGLAAGLTYGLYSIFQKVIVRRYHPWTIQWYGLFWGGLVLMMLQPRDWVTVPLTRPDTYLWLLALMLISTLVPGLLYTTGVQWIPVSVASIIATLEPVAATVMGYVILGERLSFTQGVGGALILLAVWLLRPRGGEEGSHEQEQEEQQRGDGG